MIEEFNELSDGDEDDGKEHHDPLISALQELDSTFLWEGLRASNLQIWFALLSLQYINKGWSDANMTLLFRLLKKAIWPTMNQMQKIRDAKRRTLVDVGMEN